LEPVLARTVVRLCRGSPNLGPGSVASAQRYCPLLVIPTSRSTSAGTPASRHAEYVIPFDFGVRERRLHKRFSEPITLGGIILGLGGRLNVLA